MSDMTVALHIATTVHVRDMGDEGLLAQCCGHLTLRRQEVVSNATLARP